MLTVAARAAKAQNTFSTLNPFLDKQQIKTIVRNLAFEINAVLGESALLVLTIYPEGQHFANRLTQNLADLGMTVEENYIDLRVENDKFVLRAAPRVSLKGREILIVTPVLKDGLIASAVLQYCKDHGARAAYCTTLVNMPNARLSHLKKLQPNFCRVESDDLDLVGFGKDLDGFYRNQFALWSHPKSVSASGVANNTASIILTLGVSKKNSKPLFLQSAIPLDEEALEQKRNAEITFSKLDLLLTKKQVKQKVRFTAAEVEAKFAGLNPAMMTMQKGASHFATLLTEQMPNLLLEECYMHVTRYGKSQKGGQAKILVQPSIDLKDRHTVIIEDLLQGGMTVALAIKMALKMGAAKVYVIALANKALERLPGYEDVKGDFVCFEFDERFLVGTGLDEQEWFRSMIGMWAHQPQPKAIEAEAEQKAFLRSSL